MRRSSASSAETVEMVSVGVTGVLTGKMVLKTDAEASQRPREMILVASGEAFLSVGCRTDGRAVVLQEPRLQ